MPPIGETLREARMRQGFDIVDVEERTKIRAKYLRALENEDWDLLPGPTFVKTFLRTYAEQVGLDPHLLVEEYRSHHEPVEEQELQPLGQPARGRDRRAPRPPGPPGRGLVIVGLAVALVAFLLVLGLTGGDDDGGGSKGATSTATTAQKPAKPKPRKKRKRRAPASGVTVRIAPTVPTYACLDTGQGTDVVFEGILEAPRTFRNAKELRLNLGKRSVSLRANGKAVKVEPDATPLGLRITRTGARDLGPEPRPCS